MNDNNKKYDDVGTERVKERKNRPKIIRVRDENDVKTKTIQVMRTNGLFVLVPKVASHCMRYDIET